MMWLKQTEVQIKIIWKGHFFLIKPQSSDETDESPRTRSCWSYTTALDIHRQLNEIVTLVC